MRASRSSVCSPEGRFSWADCNAPLALVGPGARRKLIGPPRIGFYGRAPARRDHRQSGIASDVNIVAWLVAAVAATVVYVVIL